MYQKLGAALLALATLAAAEVKIVVAAGGPHTWASNAEALGQYRKAAANAVIVAPGSDQELAREIADADAVIGGVTPEVFSKARKLRWLQTISAGVEAYGWKEFVESPVVLTNCKIVQGPTIADHAMSMLLAHTRGLKRFFSEQLREEWSRNGEGLTELQDMTAVVIGVGGIGSQIAQRAHAFGMTVIGVDPKDIPASTAISRVVPPDQLDGVLPLADVVFVAAPLTTQSRHMLGARQFDLMKNGSYLIAVSRGELYDTAALVKALDSKKLAGAGLDVTAPEPLPKGHALWKFPNVIITPHVASQSPGSRKRRLEVITENIRRFSRGQGLLNVVDKQKGY
ncbi:MAG: D-2-hydroxyacid dehydrogenase [Acidobacteria bacterium]|nr:D-2-hydroxyacid dehydrogenase [Acidobacteriota bacterium]